MCVRYGDFFNIERHKIINTALNMHAHIHVRMSYYFTNCAQVQGIALHDNGCILHVCGTC